MDASKRLWGMRAHGKPLAFFCAIALCAGPAAAGVLDARGESFEALSRNDTYVHAADNAPEASAVWLRGDEMPTDSVLSSDGFSAHRPRASASGSFETFELADGYHHSREGSGWVEHGGLGDPHEVECDFGCSMPSAAVPEPGKFLLTLAGLLAVVFFVKRRARVGSRLALAR